MDVRDCAISHEVSVPVKLGQAQIVGLAKESRNHLCEIDDIGLR